MPVIFVCLACFGGVILADCLGWNLAVWLWISLGCLPVFALLLFWARRKYVAAVTALRPGLIAGMMLGFLMGAIRYQASLPDLKDPSYIASFAGQAGPALITGVVAGYPDSRDQIVNLRLQVESISSFPDHQPVPCHGLVLVKIPVEEKIRFGDRVQVSGYLQLPPEEEDFNYRAYLKRQKIYAYLPRAEITLLESGQGNPLLELIYNLRYRGLEVIYRIWPDPEASLLAGILLGVETGISEGVQKAFRETGTTHIIAISGFNITGCSPVFSAGCFHPAGRRWPPWRASAFTPCWWVRMQPWSGLR